MRLEVFLNSNQSLSEKETDFSIEAMGFLVCEDIILMRRPWLTLRTQISGPYQDG